MKLALLLLPAFALLADNAGDARKVLTEGAHAKEGDQRRETAIAMSLISAKDSAASLIETMLTDKDYQVRVAATETLGEWNDAKRLPLLRNMMQDDVPEVAFAAAKALYGMKQPEGRDALQAVYEGDMKAKSNFFKKEMMNSWRRLKTPKSALLFTVSRGIGFVPVPGIGAGYNAMVGMLGDAEFSVRAVSLLLTCEEKSKVCDEMLAASFADEDWTVRAAGIHLAATKNLRPLEPSLVTLLADKKDKVRLRAAAGILRLEARRPVRATAAKKPMLN
jgi:HEAT repeat protein